jgi:hypothetical protein
MSGIVTEGRERFRLKQGGIPVAWAEGPNALGEINRYAMVYGQDGPVQIERHTSGKWKSWAPKPANTPSGLDAEGMKDV